MNPKLNAQAQTEQNHGRQKYGKGPDDFEHDDRHTAEEWIAFINDKLAQAIISPGPMEYRQRMIQVLGLAASAVEAFDRKNRSVVQTSERTSDFESDLKILINCYSKENGSDTPDLILARFICRCLEAYDYAVQQREQWYGRGQKPCAGPYQDTAL